MRRGLCYGSQKVKTEVKKYLAEIGQRGGRVKSEAKAEAARIDGGAL